MPAAYRKILLLLSVPQDDFRIRQHRFPQQFRRQFRQRRREHVRRFPAQERLALRRGFHAEQGQRRLVHPGDPSLGVENDQPVRKRYGQLFSQRFSHPLPAPGRTNPLHGVQAKQGQHTRQQHPRPQQDGALPVLSLRHFERGKVKAEKDVGQRPCRRFIPPPPAFYLGVECLEDHERP